jgi:PKD repeat protein
LDSIATFTNSSVGASTYSWDFGDGNTSTSTNPTNNYQVAGTYTVTLTAINGDCSSEFVFDVVIEIAGINELFSLNSVKLFPNPASESVNIELVAKEVANLTITVVDNSGKVVYNENNVMVVNGKNVHSLNTSNLNSGLYTVVLISENQVAKTIKLAINK